MDAVADAKMKQKMKDQEDNTAAQMAQIQATADAKILELMKD